MLTTPTHAPLAHPTYRSDIDGLRAVAVLSVLAFQAFPGLVPGGFVGVDIFFVISGYLISTIILGNLAKGSFSFAEFYIRRVRRIFPALFIVLVACLAVGWFLLLADDYHALGRHVAGGAAFISNLLLWQESGYFDQSASLKPLLHLWSLGIEEQFYIVWPLTLWLAWRIRAKPLLVVLLILAASFTCNLWWTRSDPVEAFYSPISRLWELVVGTALAANRPGLPTAVWKGALPARIQYFGGNHAASIAGAGLVVVALAWLNPAQAFPGWRAVLPTLGALLLIAAGPHAVVNRYVLSTRVMVWIGLVSYPLYLWHWPLLAFLNIHYAGSPPATVRGAALVGSIVLAAATYRWVEKPFRFGPRRWQQVAALGTGMIAVALAGFVVVANHGFVSRFPSAVARYANYQYEYRTDARAGSCWLSKDQPSDGFAQNCADPETGNHPLLVIWGDSHAARLFPGLRAIMGDRYRLAQYTRDACPPYLTSKPYCAANNAYVLGAIKHLRPDAVLLFAYWNNHAPRPEAVGRRLTRTIGKLQQAGVANVIVVGPSAQWHQPLPKTLMRLYSESPFQQPPLRLRSGLAAGVRELDDYLAWRYADRPGVTYFSAYTALCNSDGCLTRIGNNPDQLATWDYGHLSTPAATYIARRIEASGALTNLRPLRAPTQWNK